MTGADDLFWTRVNKTETCWLFTGTNGEGYGRLGRTINGKHVIMGAHRYAYLHLVGPIPPGFYVRHLCNRRACVRPDHLALGTAAENGADTARSGRARNQWTGKLHSTPVPIHAFAWCAGAYDGRVSMPKGEE